MGSEFDAVIIGSGAGGAPIADKLVRAGRTVLVLEKGPLLLTQQQAQAQAAVGLSDFKRDELLATGPERRITIKVPSRRALQGTIKFIWHLLILLGNSEKLEP